MSRLRPLRGPLAVLKRAWPVLLVPIVAFVAASRIGEAGDTFGRLSLADVPLLALSVAAMLGTIVSIGWLWAAIVGSLADRHGSRWPLLRFFLLSWPGRYIPGTLPYHAARIAFAERLGAPRRTVAASLAYEALFQVGTAALVGVVCVVLALGTSDAMDGKYLMVLAPLVFLPAFAHPRVLMPVCNRLLRMAGRETIPSSAFLSGRQTLALLAGYAFAYVVNGLSFFLVLATFTSEPDFLLAVGAANLAGAAGIAVIFLPSGIGVREAVIVAILSSSIPPETALVVAGTARALSVIADFGPLAAIAVVELMSRSLTRRARSNQGLSSQV